MPFATAFVVMPMILSKRIATKLPKSTNARLDIWLRENIELKYIFIENAKNIQKYTKEALIFSLHHKIVKSDKKDRLTNGKLRRSKSIKEDEELSFIIKKSQFVGRWLSKTDDPVILYSLLGIKP